ncbi:MAG: hypothetical protein ACPH4O_06480 [Flavobacteriaceae bacterium]
MKLFIKITLFSFSMLVFSCSYDNNQPKSNEHNKVTTHNHKENKNVQFHSLKNNELIATTDLNNKGEFKHYYLIQSDKKIEFDSQKNDSYDIEFSDTYLIFKGQRGNIIFSIDDKNINMFKSKENEYFSVYGISKRYSGKSPINIKYSVLRMGGLECHSGGEGASECSAESGAPLGGNCSVKCRNSHYACCDDTRNECKCVQNGRKPNEITPA